MTARNNVCRSWSAAIAAVAMVGTLSACGGFAPLRTEAPDPAMVAQLNRMNAHPCNEATAAALAGYDVAPEQIRELFYTAERRDGDDKNRITGWLAWMGLEGQGGRLVVETDARTCRVVQVYTRYGASVPGVPSF